MTIQPIDLTTQDPGIGFSEKPIRAGLRFRLNSALADLGYVDSKAIALVQLSDPDARACDRRASAAEEHLVRCLEELADPEVRPWALPGRAEPAGPVQLTFF